VLPTFLGVPKAFHDTRSYRNIRSPMLRFFEQSPSAFATMLYHWPKSCFNVCSCAAVMNSSLAHFTPCPECLKYIKEHDWIKPGETLWCVESTCEQCRKWRTSRPFTGCNHGKWFKRVRGVKGGCPLVASRAREKKSRMCFAFHCCSCRFLSREL
jgi:hypothetical protein